MQERESGCFVTCGADRRAKSSTEVVLLLLLLRCFRASAQLPAASQRCKRRLP
jgi:hypothetical protein